MKIKYPILTPYPDEIQFEVYGDSIAKQRARIVRNKKDDTSAGVHGFTPKETVEWEASVYGQSLKHRPPYPWKGPTALGVLFFKRIPRTWSKLKLEQIKNGLLRPQGKKDDYDNLIKAVKDALRGIYYMDDGDIVEYIQVNDLNPGKYYSETPRVIVRVKFLKDLISL